MKPVVAAWPEVSLGEVCEFRYGKALPEADRVSGDFPVFGSNGIVGYHNEGITQGTTIVVGRKGSVGEVHLSPVACWPIDTTYYVDGSATNADLNWLAYRLCALGLTKLNRAAAIPGLNREDAYRKRLLLPPIAEQRRIAKLLDEVQTLRTKRRAVLAQLDTLDQALFLDLFGNPIRNERLWPLSKLGELAQIERGKFTPRPRNDPRYYGGRFPFIQTGDISNSEGRVTSWTVSVRATTWLTRWACMEVRGCAGPRR